MGAPPIYAINRMEEKVNDSDPPFFAAAVYEAKTGDRRALARFVGTLKEESVRVGGILQEKIDMEESGMKEVVSVDVRSGKRVTLNRPTRENWENRVCSLDTAALAETASILNQAIGDKLDLIVIEKYGDTEKKGGGLSGEIFRGIAAGIPFLVAVPNTNLDAWLKHSGGTGAILHFDEAAFREWWDSRHVTID